MCTELQSIECYRTSWAVGDDDGGGGGRRDDRSGVCNNLKE